MNSPKFEIKFKITGSKLFTTDKKATLKIILHFLIKI